MQSFNYHTHTYRCGHADNRMQDEDYVKEFIKKGFKKIAFTDHAPQKEQIDKRLYMRMEYSQLNEYIESINALKDKYKGSIDIETGFEIEFLPGQEKNLFELKQLSDKLILGQHFIYNEDNTGLKTIRIDIFNDEDLIKYASYIKTAMEIKLPDIVAHPDLFMLSSTFFGKAEDEATKIICKAAEESRIPLEINLAEAASHISNPNNKIHYPCKEFWRIASEYDINVVYGIDAHNKGQIELYEKSMELVNKIIGSDVIEKLHFLDNF
ncbi:MAG: histidinol-phosphatase [Clostridia bacterium]|nr:histidinol-phosphatase [Clostridia bacterium]